MICSVISRVLSTRLPVESELALDHMAAKPMEYHVHGFGTLGENGIVGVSQSSVIFVLDGRRPPGPFNFYESLA